MSRLAIFSSVFPFPSFHLSLLSASLPPFPLNHNIAISITLFPIEVPFLLHYLLGESKYIIQNQDRGYEDSRDCGEMLESRY